MKILIFRRQIMKMKAPLCLSFFIMLDIVACIEDPISLLKRSSFPPDFIFGTASSAYQYEGAANEGGRGPSIWDTFTSRFPGKIKDHSSGKHAEDAYHRYKEDVQMMKDIGFDAYRFSISWSRLLPGGNLSAGVNPEGIEYYNNLINELLSKGLKPFVTLFHWDLPQALEDEYRGFLSPKIVKDFQDYAELCFEEYGDRVKHWITLNEPLTFADRGYAGGTFAPGRCSKWVSSACNGGNSGTEPYMVAHYQLLAHAAAVKVYRDKFQVFQKGQIGIALNGFWIKPLNINSTADQNAASRALDFSLGWFMEPLNSGTYPAQMVSHVKERLPNFSKEESLTVKGSFDFIGINYYSAMYATTTACETEHLAYSTDSCVTLSQDSNGTLIGPKAASSWLCVYPKGIQDILLYMKNTYNSPTIYITENGIDEFNDGAVLLNDTTRIEYYSNHLSFLHSSILNGVNVKGFFAWSLMDNFEWTDGYTVRFGIFFVDYKDGLKRYPKMSANWFKRFLHEEHQVNLRLHVDLVELKK